MSTPRRCDVVELEKNRWYIFVAIDEHDYDFCSFLSFGHFNTSNEAWSDGLSQVSNPGGGNTYSHKGLSVQDRIKYQSMLKKCPARRPLCGF